MELSAGTPFFTLSLQIGTNLEPRLSDTMFVPHTATIIYLSIHLFYFISGQGGHWSRFCFSHQIMLEGSV